MNTAVENELVITRIFDAPRELVWRAWSQPEHFMRWWGPKNFTSPLCKIDFREGGKFLFCMQTREGKRYYDTGVYNKIVRLEKIIYTDCFADETGEKVPPSFYDMPGDSIIDFKVTITFEEEYGKTKITIRHAGFPAFTMRDDSVIGWNESLDKLADSLK